jgi:hypothetical protein
MVVPTATNVDSRPSGDRLLNARQSGCTDYNSKPEALISINDGETYELQTVNCMLKTKLRTETDNRERIARPNSVG